MVTVVRENILPETFWLLRSATYQKSALLNGDRKYESKRVGELEEGLDRVGYHLPFDLSMKFQLVLV